MGIETQAILLGNHSAEAVAELLANVCKASDVNIRRTHQPDFKTIEFCDSIGVHKSLDLFLNSYAASDYADVVEGETVLLSMEFSPQSYATVVAIVDAFGGYARRVSSDPWSHRPRT
jgi:hypothetical protein